MRIDGSIAPYSPDRGPRSGTAVTPYREAPREAETRREQPAAVGATQGFEPTPQIRRVQASSEGEQSRAMQAQDLVYQQPAISNRASQAIASYSTTAQFITESDAQQVLGLDLYA